MEFKYQTQQMDAIMETLRWSGIFSEDFKNLILGVYMSQNIEEMWDYLFTLLSSQTFITEGFKNHIMIAINSVVRYRKENGLDITRKGKSGQNGTRKKM